METVVSDINKYNSIHLEVQGTLVAVKPRLSTIPRPNQAHRGIVTDFTRKSRLRLIRRTNRISATRATFCTLTYPKRYPGPRLAKQHLRAFFERIRRRYPNASGIWRLEPQKRGAPHFHIIFYNLPYIKFWIVRQWWTEIIRNYVDYHKPRVQLKRLFGLRDVLRYVSKYVSKASEASTFFIVGPYLHARRLKVPFDNVGRYWGVFNDRRIPYAPRLYVVAEQVTDTALQPILARLKQEWEGVETEWKHGVVVFSDYAYLAFLDCLYLAGEDLPAAHSYFVQVAKERYNGNRTDQFCGDRQSEARPRYKVRATGRLFQRREPPGESVYSGGYWRLVSAHGVLSQTLLRG